MAFVTNNESPLIESPELVFDINRITNILIKDQRFNIKAYKGKKGVEYDYEQLGALTYLLSISINTSAWTYASTPAAEAISSSTEMTQPTKTMITTSTAPAAATEKEQKYNQKIDKLSETIKRIFTSIEDSGASHLRRTQAKEELEALHYRIVYSIRTKPPPKKNLFDAFAITDTNNTTGGIGGWKGDGQSRSFIDRFLARNRIGGGENGESGGGDKNGNGNGNGNEDNVVDMDVDVDLNQDQDQGGNKDVDVDMNGSRHDNVNGDDKKGKEDDNFSVVNGEEVEFAISS